MRKQTAVKDQPPDVFKHPGFLRFWTASTVSDFGSYITTMAMAVLVVVTLDGSATDVGFLNAARWLPYLLFGLVIGALVDRRRRQPILVATDLGRSLVLGLIPLLWFVGWLTVPRLMALMMTFGFMSLLNTSANQSFLPRLVPQSSLLAANARLDQSASVAETLGPVAAGALVTALGAPLAILVDAASYLISGLAVARIRVTEIIPARRGKRVGLRREIADGLSWVYRHRMLAPLAITTHG